MNIHTNSEKPIATDLFEALILGLLFSAGYAIAVSVQFHVLLLTFGGAALVTFILKLDVLSFLVLPVVLLTLPFSFLMIVLGLKGLAPVFAFWVASIVCSVVTIYILKKIYRAFRTVSTNEAQMTVYRNHAPVL